MCHYSSTYRGGDAGKRGEVGHKHSPPPPTTIFHPPPPHVEHIVRFRRRSHRRYYCLCTALRRLNYAGCMDAGLSSRQQPAVVCASLARFSRHPSQLAGWRRLPPLCSHTSCCNYPSPRAELLPWAMSCISHDGLTGYFTNLR